MVARTLLYPFEKYRTVDLHAVRKIKVFLTYRTDLHVFVAPSCFRGADPLDVAIVWVVLLQPQKGLTHFVNVDFEGSFGRTLILEDSRPHHDERHVAGQARQRRQKRRYFLPEVGDMANVRKLAGLWYGVDLHQRMHQGQYHLLAVGERGNSLREVMN